MDWSGWAVFGFAATLALTGIMVGAQLAGLTRMDLPMMLGTMFVEDVDRARVVGFFVHLINGQFFALFYAAAFDRLQQAAWWIGAIFGAFHGVAALTLLVPLLPGIHPRMASERGGPNLDAVLEPPGLLALNYGGQTALITFLAHVIYGAILGFFLTP
ncbi:MAG: hypothetical protein M3198_07785 [Actinomycetota bacterium]|nr:hypothetical protein [Actinomycetota bacterium]